VLKGNKLNPLNFFELRTVKVPPPHFEYITIPLGYNLQDSICKWIHDNLKGRYYVGKCIDISNESRVDIMLKIGFEESKELSYFTLACPHLKYK
jgi:hypothetical protein